MFYHTYRPQKFNELKGNDHIIAPITSAIKNKTLAHAFFFYGGRGTGKTTTARLLAKALNCSNPVIIKEPRNVHLEPCGECDSCKAIKQGNHLDLIEIDAASNRGIDNIRDLRDTINLSPSMSSHKIYIIDEVHMLTKEASNALLKTLEEPPAHAYFVLCTTNPEKVLSTVKSRCMQCRFNTPSESVLVEKLELINTTEKLGLSAEDLNKIAIAAKGAYREAETILEQIANNGGDINQILGKNYEYKEFLEFLLIKDAKSALEIVSEAYNKGLDMQVWTDGFVEYLRNLLLINLGVVVGNNKAIDPVSIKNIMKVFVESLDVFSKTSILSLPLEMGVIEYCLGNKETPTEPIVLPKSPNTNKKEIVVEEKVDNKGKVADVVTTKEVKSAVKKDFPFKMLIENLKPHNHSIYLILSSCKLGGFDGSKLSLLADFSFHKERLMSQKVRNIIESVAGDLVGNKVVLDCKLVDKNSIGAKLTDKNVVQPKTKADIEKAFKEVFGEEVL